MKKVIGVYKAPRQHWVGDGFHVRMYAHYLVMVIMVNI